MRPVSLSLTCPVNPIVRVAHAGHIQESAMPEFRPGPGGAIVRRHGTGSAERTAARRRVPCADPSAQLRVHAVQVRYVQVPLAEQAASHRVPAGFQAPADADAQGTIAGDDDVGLDEFQVAGVEIDLVAEQAGAERGEGPRRADQLFLLAVGGGGMR